MAATVVLNCCLSQWALGRRNYDQRDFVFRCLKSGHIARGCSACCIHCKGRHHALLCNPMTSDPGVTSNVNVEQTQPKMPNKDVAKPSNQPVNSEAVTSHTAGFTGVSSATNNIMLPSGARTCVLLQSVRVKVHGVRAWSMLWLESSQGSGHSLHCTEVLVICVPIYRPEVPFDLMSAFGKLQFADVYGTGQEVKVDNLIGSLCGPRLSAVLMGN